MCVMPSQPLVEIEAASMADNARGQGLPLGLLRYPVESSMRHLVLPLAGHVSYKHGVFAGPLAGQ